MPESLQQGVLTSILGAAISGTGNPFCVPNSRTQTRVNITGAGTISGGTLIIEESEDPTFAGVWSQILSVAAITLTGGALQTLHIFSTLGFIRARISANITGGGTVAVTAMTGD